MSDEWSIEDEIRLCRWISVFKPAGMHKHFHMISILERMNNPDMFPVVLLFDKLKSEGKSIFTAADVWAKLGEYYDLQRLDDLEDNTKGEDEDLGETSEKELEQGDIVLPLRRLVKLRREFSLPWDDYGELMVENARDGEREAEERDEQIVDDDEEEQEVNEGDASEGQESGDEQENGSNAKRVTRSSIASKPGRLTRSRGAVGHDEEDNKRTLDTTEVLEEESSDKPQLKKTRGSKNHIPTSVPTPDLRPLRSRRKSLTAAPIAPTRSSGRVASRLRNKK